MTTKLHNVEETAELLGNISPWTVRKYASKGLLRVTRIGSRVLFASEEIERVRREGLPSIRHSARPKNPSPSPPTMAALGVSGVQGERSAAPTIQTPSVAIMSAEKQTEAFLPNGNLLPAFGGSNCESTRMAIMPEAPAKQKTGDEICTTK